MKRNNYSRFYNQYSQYVDIETNDDFVDEVGENLREDSSLNPQRAINQLNDIKSREQTKTSS